MKSFKQLPFVVFLLAVSAAMPGPAAAESHDRPAPAASQAGPAHAREIVIGGGNVAGVYFPVAGAICRIVAAHDPQTRCLVESNANSSANLQRLASGLLDFAIVQSDWLMHAANGTNLFRAGGPDETLRAVMALHAEPLTLIARAGARIGGPQDLEGKRLSLGPTFTYQRVLLEALLAAHRIDTEDLAMVVEYSASEQFTALCAGEIDAAAIVTAHPSPLLADAMQRCELVLVPITGRPVEKLIESRPELAPAVIEGGLYAGAPDPVPSFGLRAILASTSQTDDAQVAQLVGAILDAMPDFNGQHPVTARIEAREMAKAGIAVPLHDGAAQAFRARGLLP